MTRYEHSFYQNCPVSQYEQVYIMVTVYIIIYNVFITRILPEIHEYNIIYYKK